ncbi:hypothetical protein J6590_048263 [Homalodisca vitripennis]|nr:hypothetical protein J6590_048263 [Homalodisca vitripennis]
MTCPNCLEFIYTKLYSRPTRRTVVANVVLSVTGLFCIPMCCRLYHYCVHLCPMCLIYLGRTSRRCIKKRWVCQRRLWPCRYAKP